MNIVIVSLGKTASGNQDPFFLFVCCFFCYTVNIFLEGWVGGCGQGYLQQVLFYLFICQIWNNLLLTVEIILLTQVFILHLIPPANADKVIFPVLQLHYNTSVFEDGWKHLTCLLRKSHACSCNFNGSAFFWDRSWNKFQKSTTPARGITLAESMCLKLLSTLLSFESNMAVFLMPVFSKQQVTFLEHPWTFNFVDMSDIIESHREVVDVPYLSEFPVRGQIGWGFE